MFSEITPSHFTGEIGNKDVLSDVLKFMPFNRRTLSTMRCVSKPFRNVVQCHSGGAWADHNEMFISEYGHCLLFNSKNNEQGKSCFELSAISPIDSKFSNSSAEILRRHHAAVANGLNKLTLHYAEIEHSFFTPLAALSQLTSLELVSCRALHSLQGVTGLKQLEELTVIMCPLDCDALSGVELPHLKILHLRLCGQLNDFNCIHPSTAVMMESLHIEDCNVTDNDLNQFFTHFTSHLRIVHLISVSVNWACAAIPAEALASLTELNLTNTIVYSETLEAMVPHMTEHLELLSLEECFEMRDYSCLGKLHGLRFLDVSGDNDPEDVDSVRECAKLELFRMGRSELQNIAFLANKVWLRVLDASRSSLTDPALHALRALPELDTVILSECNEISDINILHTCPKIRRIFCKRTQIEDSGISQLSKCALLEEIDLQDTLVRDVNCLAACPSLRLINVNRASDEPVRVEKLLMRPEVVVIMDVNRFSV